MAEAPMSFDGVREDLAQAVRGLLRAPRFAWPAILTIAVGLGSVTTVFTVVNGVLLRPLPYTEPHRLVSIREEIKGIGNVPFVRPAEYVAWEGSVPSLAALAGYMEAQGNLASAGGAVRVTYGVATSSLFPLLNVQPVLGRVFLPGEDRRGARPVALLSYTAWQRQFGQNPSAIGQTITLDGEHYEVVGVLPRDFVIPDRYLFERDVWIPFALGGSGFVMPPVMRAVARLAPGASADRARAELDAMLQALPRRGSERLVVVSNWQSDVTGAAARPILVLFAAVGIVLLIACVNVANLLPARALGRQQEMALRVALGASRKRLVRQLLTESLVLAAFGGAAGLAIASWGHAGLTWYLSRTLPTLPSIAVDWRVFGFAIAMALLTGLAFGVAPALLVSDTRHASALQGFARSNGGDRRGTRIRTLLVVVEVAVATMLLIAGTSLVKGVLHLRATDLGFRADRVLSVMVSLSSRQYPQPERQVQFFDEAIERTRAVAGVEWAAATSGLPLSGAGGSADITIDGREGTARVEYGVVSADYFRVMSVPLAAGRYLDASDRAGAPGAVVVNESFARQLCAGTCVGSRVRFSAREPWSTIVGVVGDIRPSLDQAPSRCVYTSYRQEPMPAMSIVARTRGEPKTVAAAVQAQVAAIARDQPPHDMATLQERLSSALAPRAANAMLIGLFSAVALALACVGVYALLSYSVAQRAGEFAVRMALGAGRTDLFALVFRYGLTTVLIGIAVGCAGAAATVHTLAGRMPDIASVVAWTYVQVGAAWVVIALAACYGPARRASTLDPLVVLRRDSA